MDAGTSGQNNRRYINVNGLRDNIGKKTCQALPALHAFTGCDYTVSMHEKGTFKHLTLYIWEHMDAFVDLGNSEVIYTEQKL